MTTGRSSLYRNTSATGASVQWVVTSRTSAGEAAHTKKRNEWPERKRRNKDKIVGTTQKNIKQTRMERGRGSGAGRGCGQLEGEGGTKNSLQRLTYFETVLNRTVDVSGRAFSLARFHPISSTPLEHGGGLGAGWGRESPHI